MCTSNKYLIPWDNLAIVKALAILSVILVHIPNMCRPGMVLLNFGVPLFLMVQSYIVFAKLERGERSVASYYSLSSVWKIVRRIILPWLVLVAIEWFIGLRSSGGISDILALGAIGPGSYYLFVYLCFYMMLPLLWLVMKSLPTFLVLILGILCAIVLDLSTASLISFLPDVRQPSAYRFLPCKFFMLAPLAYVLLKSTPYANGWRTSFVCLGLMSLIFLSCRLIVPEFTHLDFGCDYGWTTAHWWAYFYPALLMLIILSHPIKCEGGGGGFAGSEITPGTFSSRKCWCLR